jgi:hypothetical protein
MDNIMLQYLLAGLILVWAVYKTGKHLYREITEGENGGCKNCPLKKRTF